MTGGSATDQGPNGMRAVDRAIAVLTILVAHPTGISLADLARASEIPLTTLHRLLRALRSASLVRETTTGLYTVGVGTVVLARAFLDGLDLREAAKPHMAQVVGITGETCHLGVLASTHIVYIEKIDSPHPVRMYSRVGETNPALTTAVGRAILAYSPEAAVADVIAASQRPDGLATDRDELLKVLADVRQNGYSTDFEHNEMGICCVGAPVFDHTARVVAGMSLSTPASRFDRERLEETAALLTNAAAALSQALGCPSNPSLSQREGPTQ